MGIVKQSELNNSDKNKAKDYAKIFAGDLNVVKKPENQSFESVQNLGGGVDVFIERFMVPWLIKVMAKYPEWEFHEKMAGFYYYKGGWYKGWNFLGDMFYNHKKAFKSFIWVCRQCRNKMNINVDRQTNNLVNVIQTNGWKVTMEERNSINIVLSHVHDLIYK